MAFQDIYPEGHQAGVVLIQHGVRVASNGDLRLDPVPGQWQPMPKQDKRVVAREANEIVTWLSYPALRSRLCNGLQIRGVLTEPRD